jgi:hypothetical protein
MQGFPMNYRHRTVFYSLLLLVSLSPASAFGDELSCDPDFVTLDEGIIAVTPNDTDDTQNIQCALDEAKAINAPVVRLTKGQFYISHIQIADFRGTLEGSKISATFVDVIDSSINCQGLFEGGQKPAALKFINGKVQVRTMTLRVGNPCPVASGFGFYLIHFTGEDAFSGCEPGTGHGFVDRVHLLTDEPVPDQRYVNVALAANAEGFEGRAIDGQEDSCRRRQFGTLKLNRSLISRFYNGVELSLRASAQVDVTFNEFVDMGNYSIELRDAGQITSIQQNYFFSEISVLHIKVRHGTAIPEAATRNRVVIHRNTFFSGHPSGEIYSPGAIDLDKKVDTDLDGVFSHDIDLSAVISDNSFNVTPKTVSIVHATLAHGLIVANNTFKGTAITAVDIRGEKNLRGTLYTENTSITGNSFANLELLEAPHDNAHIQLWNETRNSVVGPAQSATITDLGEDNLIGDQF